MQVLAPANLRGGKGKAPEARQTRALRWIQRAQPVELAGRRWGGKKKGGGKGGGAKGDVVIGLCHKFKSTGSCDRNDCPYMHLHGADADNYLAKAKAAKAAYNSNSS